jgi:uncharacterized protein YndB with AHSA1/START domain
VYSLFETTTEGSFVTTTIHNHIDIAATPEQVWEVLADLDRLHEYDPVVTRSTLVGGQQAGVGAQRRCEARQGRYFVETVTEWEHPNRLQFTIVDCNLPTRDLTHTYALDATPNGTRVSQVMRYDTRFGPVGAILDRVIIRRKTDQGIKGFLAGLNTIVTNAHSSTVA